MPRFEAGYYQAACCDGNDVAGQPQFFAILTEVMCFEKNVLAVMPKFLSGDQLTRFQAS